MTERPKIAKKMNICHLKGLLVITRIENGKSQADGLPESIETHTKVRLNKQKLLFFHIKETVIHSTRIGKL